MVNHGEYSPGKLVIEYAKLAQEFPDIHSRRLRLAETELEAFKADPGRPSPLHCKPWVDGQTLGIDVPFPFRETVSVRTTSQGVVELVEPQSARDAVGAPVLARFSEGHFGLASGYRFHTARPYGLLVLAPDPSTRTGPLEGLIETWWYPKSIFFVFPIPNRGRETTFTPGEIVARLIPVTTDKVNVEQMGSDRLAKLAADEEAYLAFGAPPHSNLRRRRLGDLARPYADWSDLLHGREESLEDR